jgi:hypothetical protein
MRLVVLKRGHYHLAVRGHYHFALTGEASWLALILFFADAFGASLKHQLLWQGNW